MLVLLVEDDDKITKLLIKLLTKDGYQVDHAFDGEEALIYCQQNRYDVIIIDWMMPVMDGIETIKRLREMKYSSPILMLTAKDDLDDKITGLDSGADDYLIKPFEYRELTARIKALARRGDRVLNQDVVTVGHLQVNRTSKTVSRNEHTINLTNREYQLFIILFENIGQVIPKNVLIDRVWGLDVDVTPNNLETYIRRLRKKIENSQERYIVNVRGVGYKMEIKDV
ncbi:response regulator transcription factor [Wukongibacter baidiensis]|uniref:response regulator transcription factor n=1 Tax=Wukongibacter baidiensis TaxID=1723361 RepID=UPI003D7F7602